MLKLPIYLDNNATTPMDPRVLEAMTPYFLQHFGNAASRNHPFGWEAEEAVDYAREQVAKLIGADPKEIIFTSGATESDNLAIKGMFEMYAGKGNHIITASTEHKAVLDTCRQIEKLGGEVTYLPVKPDGLVDLTIQNCDAILDFDAHAGTLNRRLLHGGNDLICLSLILFFLGGSRKRRPYPAAKETVCTGRDRACRQDSQHE